jgi:hypothetical protein
VGVEDRNEDVVEEEASGPSSVPDAPTPSAEDGGVIFVLEKASLEVAKVGKVKKTKEIPSPFLSGEEGGEFFFRGSRDRDVRNERDYKGDAIRGRGLRTPFRGSKWRGALGACAASFGLPDLLHYFSLQSLSLSDFQSFIIMGFLSCLIFTLFQFCTKPNFVELLYYNEQLQQLH